jgi:hypothetical protein
MTVGGRHISLGPDPACQPRTAHRPVRMPADQANIRLIFGPNADIVRCLPRIARPGGVGVARLNGGSTGPP